MSKYKILENKLIKISKYIDDMDLQNEASIKYLGQYKDYVEKLILAVQNKTIRNSDGAVLGLTRGISDYDEICEDGMLWNLAIDADKFYSDECKFF
jgi:hypothetical protein